MDELVAVFALGAAMGGMIVAAWKHDQQRKFWIKDGVIHCTGPISAEDATQLREAWEAWRIDPERQLRVVP